MNIAFLDTHSGIAGDMLLAALVDAGADQGYLQQQINSLNLGDVRLKFTETHRQCFRALRLDIEHPPEHVHRNLRDILAVLERSQLNPREREMATRLFRKLGEAEAKVHGTSIDEVHFHEVGAIDSIVDIVGIAVALSSLEIKRIVASPTPVGSGTIRIAHGEVSVPAPATAELLRGIPIRSSAIQAELTTPTGAAVLATLADAFGPVPDMQLQRIGYGAGHRELAEQANVLRVLIGKPLAGEAEQVTLLETNLDHVTGEQIGFAIERLWELGALDVYTAAISMKKNRPGTILSVLCHSAQRQALEECLFEQTGTLGVRRQQVSRRTLPRAQFTLETPLGPARVKVAWRSIDGSTAAHVAPEYEDCRRLSLQHNRPLGEVMQIVRRAAEQEAGLLRNPSAAEQHQEHAHHAHDHHDHDHDHHH